ncbi:MAG: protein kinase [Chloroflexota bacterium]
MNGNLNDPIGQHIAHYAIERRIGGGAMASVYQATDEILDRTIALKILLPGADALTRQRFRQEARTVSILEHPNIVRTLQVGQTGADGVAYIAMDLVKGKSLSTLLDEESTLPVAAACALLEPVARALAYAHSLGVVHRDVKPSNILLRMVESGAPNGNFIIPSSGERFIPYLSDFGIARALDSPELTSAGRTIGTPAYMAPEQCAGSREIDGRADIYSLGTVLYRCLVGRPPFIGTTTQILHAHVYEPLMIPDDVLRDLPPAVIDALRRSLMKEPEYRYKDASEMADTLLTVIEQYGTSTNASSFNGTPTYSQTRKDELAPTRTIATMPAAESNSEEDSGSTSQILIPGPLPGGEPKKATSTQTPVILKAQSGSTTHQRVVHPLPQSTKRQTNWIGLALGATMLLLISFIGIALVRALQPTGTPELSVIPSETRTVFPTDVELTGTLPNQNEENLASITTPTTEADGAEIGSVQPASGELALAPTAISETVLSEEAIKLESSPADEDSAEIETLSPTSTTVITSAESPVTGPSTPEPSVTISPTDSGGTGGSITPTETPADVFDGDLWFEEAAYFFERREWDLARDKLIFLRRSDSSYESELVRRMLSSSYIGLANRELLSSSSNESISNAQIASAVNFYREALKVNSGLIDLEVLVNALTDYTETPTTQQSETLARLVETLSDYANQLSNQNDFCGAMEQITVALRLQYNATLAEQQNTLAVSCPALQRLVLPPVTQDELSGSIIYSAVDSAQQSHIWRVSVEVDAQSERLVDNGRQPALSPSGTLIAFRSDGANQLGIRGFDVIGNQSLPQGRFLQITYNAEDSLFSPPTWTPNSDRILFESTVSGDRISRIYYANNNPSGQYRLIADGREPDGHPNQEILVFKGADNTGNRPGLWVMNSFGGDRQPVTGNGGDTRPKWSPNGQYIVFMNNTRHESWDIYRVDFQTSEVLRLTTDLAQDGLPTVSPNGQHVAFLSNRDNGVWKIFVVSIDGGPVQPITTISGTLPNWLEHSIQWVE